jgi:hypothetical protein
MGDATFTLDALEQRFQSLLRQLEEDGTCSRGEPAQPILTKERWLQAQWVTIQKLASGEFCACLETVRQAGKTSARFHSEANRGTLRAVDVHLGERRNDDHIEPIEEQIPACDGGGFDGLVHCAGPNRLYIRPPVVAHHPRDGAGNSGGP